MAVTPQSEFNDGFALFGHHRLNDWADGAIGGHNEVEQSNVLNGLPGAVSQQDPGASRKATGEIPDSR